MGAARAVVMMRARRGRVWLSFMIVVWLGVRVCLFDIERGCLEVVLGSDTPEARRGTGSDSYIDGTIMYTCGASPPSLGLRCSRPRSA